MVGIIQVAVRGKVVTGDHDTFLHPLCCCTGRRWRFASALLWAVPAERHCMLMQICGQMNQEPGKSSQHLN
jgi:hypothetical protein